MKTGKDILEEYKNQEGKEIGKFVTLEEMIDIALAERFSVENINLNDAEEGSILVIKSDGEFSHHVLNDIAGKLPKGVCVWVASHCETIELFGEEQMNAAGWYRK